MGDTALDRNEKGLLEGPAAERLKEELRLYVTARFEAAATRLGERLGEALAGLAEPGAGRDALVKGLQRGRRALGEGKTPLRAALTVGAHAAKDSVRKKAVEAVGGGPGPDGGSAKRVTVVEDVDVGVPVDEAYDQWTRFQESGGFARDVLDTEQILDQRIAWTARAGRGTVHGVVTFHRLTGDLTRVLLVLEYAPRGLLGRAGNVWRAPGRRARLHLERYRAHLMLRGEGVTDEVDADESDAHEQEAEDDLDDLDDLDEDEPEAEEAEFHDEDSVAADR
ncbi:cyclase [Streptomyces roseolus]|uniref:cyclase n=1 Tax=Streptomyces roseolus TaxID=67358 RepID=UPI0033E7F987